MSTHYTLPKRNPGYASLRSSHLYERLKQYILQFQWMRILHKAVAPGTWAVRHSLGSHLQWNKKRYCDYSVMMSWLMGIKMKKCEKKRSWPNFRKFTITDFSWRDWVNPSEASFITVHVPDGMRVAYAPNARQRRNHTSQRNKKQTNIGLTYINKFGQEKSRTRTK